MVSDEFLYQKAAKLNSGLKKVNAPFYVVCSTRKHDGKIQETWRRYSDSCIKDYVNARWVSRSDVVEYLKKHKLPSLSQIEAGDAMPAEKPYVKPIEAKKPKPVEAKKPEAKKEPVKKFRVDDIVEFKENLDNEKWKYPGFQYVITSDLGGKYSLKPYNQPKEYNFIVPMRRIAYDWELKIARIVEPKIRPEPKKKPEPVEAKKPEAKKEPVKVPYVKPIEKPVEVKKPDPVKEPEKPKPVEAKKHLKKIVEIEKLKPIKELGTGAKVYYESKAARVNDNRKDGGYYLILLGYKNIYPIHTETISDLQEAVYIAKVVTELYPQGIPDSIDFVKYIDSYKALYQKSKEKSSEKEPEKPKPVEAKKPAIVKKIEKEPVKTKEAEKDYPDMKHLVYGKYSYWLHKDYDMVKALPDKSMETVYFTNLKGKRVSSGIYTFLENSEYKSSNDVFWNSLVKDDEEAEKRKKEAGKNIDVVEKELQSIKKSNRAIDIQDKKIHELLTPFISPDEYRLAMCGISFSDIGAVATDSYSMAFIAGKTNYAKTFPGQDYVVLSSITKKNYSTKVLMELKQKNNISYIHEKFPPWQSVMGDGKMLSYEKINVENSISSISLWLSYAKEYFGKKNFNSGMVRVVMEIPGGKVGFDPERFIGALEFFSKQGVKHVNMLSSEHNPHRPFLFVDSSKKFEKFTTDFVLLMPIRLDSTSTDNVGETIYYQFPDDKVGKHIEKFVGSNKIVPENPNLYKMTNLFRKTTLPILGMILFQNKRAIVTDQESTIVIKADSNAEGCYTLANVFYDKYKPEDKNEYLNITDEYINMDAGKIVEKSVDISDFDKIPVDDLKYFDIEDARGNNPRVNFTQNLVKIVKTFRNLGIKKVAIGHLKSQTAHHFPDGSGYFLTFKALDGPDAVAYLAGHVNKTFDVVKSLRELVKEYSKNKTDYPGLADREYIEPVYQKRATPAMNDGNKKSIWKKLGF